MADMEELERRAAELERTSFNNLFSLLVECSQILGDIAPARRRPWLLDVIQDLYKNQAGKCAICKEPLSLSDIDVDHKVPFSYGGGNERNNIQLAHSSCNRSKQAQVDPHDLLRYIEDRYMNLNL
ncbi:HNH endonuclease [Pseudomonas viridiflava]|uniref:HNH endonuclease n=1 Tax=Pseudomonas viridiflava TaxID=33069 RepID=UPI000F4BA734|nr:HNH endonuclease signature motif containing protein [Pseudomonas viridiflava]